MKHSFYSIASSIIFLGLGVLHGVRSVQAWPLVINTYSVPLSLSYAITGLMFVMAYFSMTHLRHK